MLFHILKVFPIYKQTISGYSIFLIKIIAIFNMLPSISVEEMLIYIYIFFLQLFQKLPKVFYAVKLHDQVDSPNENIT